MTGEHFTITEAEYLEHYGTPRHSGRYPWGSGKDGQHSMDFLGYVDKMKKQGLSENEIRVGLKMSTTEWRAQKSIANAEAKHGKIIQAQRLKATGMSNSAIGREMGINESSVRALLKDSEKENVDIIQTTAKMLKEQVDEKGTIDVGAGVENTLGISKERLATAVQVLKDQGYATHPIPVPQLGTGVNNTVIKTLSKPGTTYRELVNDVGRIKAIQEWSNDGGRSMLGLKPPLAVSSKRIKINYDEDGGSGADGVIYVRPGVKDLSMGNARYAQVRINVDGTHYLKGMAMYKEDLPPGVDLVFNTNKKKADLGPNKLAAMKEQKDDPENPFGSMVRQIYNKDEHGVERSELGLASAMNIVNEQGDWERWRKSISSQVLSKQSPVLAKTQLNMTYETRKAQFDSIMKMTNPAVRRTLLKDFADGCDSASVHLKAAALPNQRSHVLMPFNSMSANEIYAPNYKDGTRVALIRYPHGGTFEIPELTVNNRHPEAKRALGATRDAVGINSKVAERLSGADFDGDTVLVIPQGAKRLDTRPALKGLQGFDPQIYKIPEGSDIPRISPKTKQIEMGKVSNLITDMTIRGASDDDVAAAVRHSMVVIDAEKHNLDYRQSARDNGITRLKEKYQGGPKAGASTLISKGGSEVRVNKRDPRSMKKGGPIDKETGKLVFDEPKPYIDKAGNVRYKQEKKKKLELTDDAHTLSSGTPIERVYADHSNRMKDLANQARKEMVNTKSTPYSKSAKEAYSKEVESLNAKLHLAYLNKPRERQAQVIASNNIHARKQANPDMTPEESKKLRTMALKEARTRTGAEKSRIHIEQGEWDAIQAGAITNFKLTEILKNADVDRVKELASPKTSVLMTSTKKSRAIQMLNSGYTQAEVAEALGVSLTTLKDGLG